MLDLFYCRTSFHTRTDAIIRDVALVVRLADVTMVNGIDVPRLDQSLAKGGDQCRVLRVGQAFTKENRFGSVKHRIIGSRRRNVVLSVG